MPALVNSRVGSLAGTSEEEGTRRCCFDSKKRRNSSRISFPVRGCMALSVYRSRVRIRVSTRGAASFDLSLHGEPRLRQPHCFIDFLGRIAERIAILVAGERLLAHVFA